MSIAPGGSDLIGQPDPKTIDDGGNAALCWYRWRVASGACAYCRGFEGWLVNGTELSDRIPAHSHCRCWWELDYCDEPDEPPLLPPEDPPGPGPF